MTKRKPAAPLPPANTESEIIPAEIITEFPQINTVQFTSSRKKHTEDYWDLYRRPATAVLTKNSGQKRWSLVVGEGLCIGTVAMTTDEAKDFFNKCLDMLSIVGDR